MNGFFNLLEAIIKVGFTFFLILFPYIILIIVCNIHFPLWYIFAGWAGYRIYRTRPITSIIKAFISMIKNV